MTRASIEGELRVACLVALLVVAFFGEMLFFLKIDGGLP